MNEHRNTCKLPFLIFFKVYMYIHNKLSCRCTFISAAEVQLRQNINGGIYDNGRSLPTMYRDRILDLHHDRLGERQIAREFRVSHTYVGKVIKRYDESNTDLRAQRSHFVKPKVDQTASEYIECCRLMNPSIYGSEIRQRLLLDGVVHPADIPSVSQINRVSHTQHAMTRKRITVVPRESTTPTATEAVDAFLNEISNFRASKLHFFDESSVVKTTGNRKYSSAVLGEPAIEVQRYASNSNYTINLLHSINGVDFFNILDGPSNGMELLTLFDEALQLERED